MTNFINLSTHSRTPKDISLDAYLATLYRAFCHLKTPLQLQAEYTPTFKENDAQYAKFATGMNKFGLKCNYKSHRRTPVYLEILYAMWMYYCTSIAHYNTCIRIY